MQSTVSSQPPRQICTHFRLFCSPPPRESRVSGYSWRSQLEFTDGYEMMHKAWSNIEGVPYCFSRSSVKFQGHTGEKIADFDPNWVFPDLTWVLICRWLSNDTQSFKQHRRGAPLFFKIILQISRSHETKQVSFKKEVGVMVNDLVFWLTVCIILKMYY